MRLPASILILALAAFPARAQRGAKQTARDLFYSEAGLIVSSAQSRKGRFAAAKKSVVAVTLGLKYGIWKLSGGEFQDWDSTGPFQPGDQVRLGVEINDTGYLYIVHRQPSGQWRRLFPTPEIEHGSHFVRSGLTYPVPPEEGLELQFPGGVERLFLVLSREPVKDLEALVSPPQPSRTVSAAPPPEIPDSVLERVRILLNPRDLITERSAVEKAVYVVNRTGRPDSLVATEIRLASRP